MKTKTFLLLCLILGIGLTRISAQAPKGQNGTNGSYSERFESEFVIPVFCNGQQIDLLDATFEWHHIGKYLKGEWLHCYVQIFGTAVSTSGSGEVFDVQLIGKQDNNIQLDGSWEFVANTHVNLKGNMGSHYIGSFIMDWTGVVTSVKAVCN